MFNRPGDLFASRAGSGYGLEFSLGSPLRGSWRSALLPITRVADRKYAPNSSPPRAQRGGCQWGHGSGIHTLAACLQGPWMTSDSVGGLRHSTAPRVDRTRFYLPPARAAGAERSQTLRLRSAPALRRRGRHDRKDATAPHSPGASGGLSVALERGADVAKSRGGCAGRPKGGPKDRSEAKPVAARPLARAPANTIEP